MINFSVECIDNKFLVDTVRENAKRKFDEMRAKYDAKPPRTFSFFFNGTSSNEMSPDMVLDYIYLRDGIFDVNESLIVSHHTHFVNVDLSVYRRVEAMCNAINDVFSPVGGFDQNLLLSMLYYSNGAVVPNTRFNFNLLNRRINDE